MAFFYAYKLVNIFLVVFLMDLCCFLDWQMSRPNLT
jgi:hypothetical protein